MKKIILILCAVFSAFLISCTDDLNLKFNSDGSADMEFSAQAGQALTKMLQGFADSTGSASVIDTKDIASELTANGFTNVKVIPKGLAGFTATGKDLKRESPVFSSGIVTATDKADKSVKFRAELTGEQLQSLYEGSDEQTKMLLDLLLAPVFTGEKMSEDEYVDLISSFYGASVGQEIKDSKVNLKVEDSKGKKFTKTIPLVKLLTLEEPVIFEN